MLEVMQIWRIMDLSTWRRSKRSKTLTLRINTPMPKLVVDLEKYLPQKQRQPPLLSAMVHAIYSRAGDMQLVRKSLPTSQRVSLLEFS
ncbi:uncharacterized protein LOC112020884 isoform X2 [Quercus suber]